MTRKDIRTGIATFFGGPVLTPDDWYRSSPLADLGLAGVKAYHQGRFKDNEYFGDLDGVRTGAIMCVHLDDDTEKRLAIGGILDAPFNVTLYLFFLTLTPSQADAQADRDDLVDAVRDMIRADPTLGMGINSDAPVRVLQAGEGERGIVRSTPTPYFEPPAKTMQNAVIAFTANTYPAG